MQELPTICSMEKRMEMRSWKALESHSEQLQKVHLKELFEHDSNRFSKFSLENAGLFLDFSKNRLTEKTLGLLVDLVNECGLEKQIEAMFCGEKINNTEGRPVLHTALRNRSSESLTVDGGDVMPPVQSVLSRMGEFVEEVHGGSWRGFTGRKITDVVNIGIGGSDLGPRMVVQALVHCAKEGVESHFISNIDGEELSRLLDKLNPETTLFVVVSKTFTTLETMTNANSARDWLLAELGSQKAVGFHFVAVSCNLEAVESFGIDPSNSFEFWDWVGGRFSLWSAVGLSIALSVGMNNFKSLLEGARAMDCHFRGEPFSSNMPVLLALIGIWNRNFLGFQSQAILPYDHRLRRFPAYLQQCEMESNGKSVTKDGESVGIGTVPVIWGEAGTNGQHAFYQAIHQGTEKIPADFIVALKPHNRLESHHKFLVANCFAQSEALMIGRTLHESEDELKQAGFSESEVDRLAPHKVFRGNSPSNTILLESLTPATLGALIALYEQKVFVQGVIWGINSFDQWGVELGKQMAGTIAAEISSGAAGKHDSSTEGLIARFKAGHIAK